MQRSSKERISKLKILVTGSKGVVGSLLEKKLKNNHEVTGCDLSHAPGQIGFRQKMSSEKGNYIRCDISEYRQLSRIFEENGPFDFVYNCAAEFGRWNGEDYFEQLWRSNVIGLKNLLMLQEKYNFKLIHFSSSEVYGDFEGIMSESIMNDYEIKQMNDYAISKWTNEMQIRNHIIMSNTETVVVRLFNTYGPGEHYHPYRSVNSKFCFHAINNLPITVYKGYHRSSTYIDDCVDALVNIINNFKSGKTYNIGANSFHDIETLANLIWSYTNAPADLISYQDNELLTTKVKKVDNKLSIEDLNFRETVSLEEGVKKTIDWMRQQ